MSDYNPHETKSKRLAKSESAYGGKRSAGGALGIYANYPTPLGLDIVDEHTGECVSIDADGSKISLSERLNLRYKRQTQARKALYGFNETTVYNAKGHEQHHRTCYCNHVPYSKDIDVLKHPQTEKFHLSGLATCGSASTCPICESVISERRANELRAAFKQAKAMGLHIQLLTFTIPHGFGDDIEDLRPKLSEAQQRFFNGKPWQKKREQYGIVAYARSIECRFGANGWHPHFHFIVFSEKPLPKTKLLDKTDQSKRWRKLDIEQQSDEWLWFLERWCNMCEKAGLERPNEYGLDIRDGSMAYDYICKYGLDGERLTTKKGDKQLTWDMADEITKGNKKDGKKSFSPFQLLDVLGDSNVSKEEKQRARIEFIKYARAMKGVPLMRWSKSAFDVFCFDDVTDAELLKDNNDECSLIAQFNVYQWKCILKHSSRDLFMEVVNSGCGADGIRAFVDGCVMQDKSDVVMIDTPVEENNLITQDFTSEEQLEMFDNKLAVMAQFDDAAERDGSELQATIHNGEFLDEITRSLVSKKAKWDRDTIKRGMKNQAKRDADRNEKHRMYVRLFGGQNDFKAEPVKKRDITHY